MVFEEAAKTIIYALLGCAGVFAYLGIALGKGDSVRGENTKHFPLKLFFLMLSLLMLTASVGMSALITQSQCGECGQPLDCPTATCTTYEQYVVNYTFSVFICLAISLLFVIGYFIVLFINWIIHFLNTKRSKKAFLEQDYTRGENEKQD
jgi:hypothetical protein